MNTTKLHFKEPTVFTGSLSSFVARTQPPRFKQPPQMSMQTFVTAVAGAAVACYAAAQLAPSLKKSKKSAAAGPLKNSAFVFIKVRDE